MTLSLNKLNKAAGVRGITYLPKLGKRKACYRWLLGICGKNGKCPFGHEHVPLKDVSEDFAGKLVASWATGSPCWWSSMMCRSAPHRQTTKRSEAWDTMQRKAKLLKPHREAPHTAGKLAYANHLVSRMCGEFGSGAHQISHRNNSRSGSAQSQLWAQGQWNLSRDFCRHTRPMHPVARDTAKGRSMLGRTRQMKVSCEG